MNKPPKIDHVTTGLRSFLDSPRVYIFFQKIAGGEGLLKSLTLNNLDLPDHFKMLDLGCGPATILDSLPENVTYHGYDFNTEYINFAKQKYGNRGSFHCTKIDDLQYSDEKYEIVLASAILHHVNDDEACKLFNIANNCLKDGGYLLTLDPVYADNQSKISKFIISHDRGQNVRTAEGYTKLADQHFNKIDTKLKKGWFYHLPYTFHIMKCYKSLNYLN